MNKYIIFAPTYDENSGGSIVLHKLCHILNELGNIGYLCPYEKRHRETPRYIGRLFPKKYQYKVNPEFDTPIITSTHSSDNWNEWIVVYPEIVKGNPLGAKHVVRWLLHQPGFHTGAVCYGENELYFKFGGGIKDFDRYNSKLSKNELRVFHYPTPYYQGNEPRSGTAYCIRKGIDKPIVHNLENSISIEGKSHAEIADIFRRVETFISYDPLTAYSVFAILCGAQSIVVPDKNTSIDEWMPHQEERYGIAYGFSEKDVKRANSERRHVIARAKREADDSVKSVMNFCEEVNLYFKT